MQRNAVVIGAGGGIGRALVEALEEEGVAVQAFSRPQLDLLNEASIAGAAATVTSRPSLIVVATGLLHDGDHGPEKSMRELDAAWLQRNFAINAIGPALVAKHFLPLLSKGERSVFAALSARVGSISDNRLGGWYSYRASKAALNQLIRTLSIEMKRVNDRAIVVGLHPGTVDTKLSKPFQGNVAPGQLFDPGRAAVQLLDLLDGLGVKDSGSLIAWDGTTVTP
ncbi:SDR family NAD(P)-dependent oxidoreductase [Sphingomonas sp. ID1715]|uniref:SDR family NAD(P)-dependent oxidoreductase n=1 Tax=Sphingomonas sp. ID1715 TaxID=1656898 RepID=UPI001488BFF7|nr:SDR family NAD(P)-dependent oxidoreductase [Sphingomonas sp. ID1715]NNM75534.1 SDR family NAD(P)-dependent oxidoreductase [Sphingomonas sp. ID1715]